MKFNYDRINKNLQALAINSKGNFACMSINRHSSLNILEDYARLFGVSIAKLLFDDIKSKYKTVDVTIDGDTKTFYVPIDKFEDFLMYLDELSV